LKIEVVVDRVTHIRLATLAQARGIPPERIASSFLATAINYGEKKKGRKRRRPVTQETKEKLRLSHRGHQPSPETREKMRLRALGHVVSPATRAKLRRYQLAQTENPWRFQKGHPPMGHAIPKSGR